MAFCTRCGAQIANGQRCNCTSRSNPAGTGHKTFLQRAKGWPESTKRALSIVSVLIVATILYAIIGSAITAPRNTAQSYFRAKANGNWNRVYSFYNLDKYESEFINRDSFVALNKDVDITNFNLAGTGLSYTASYNVRGSAATQTESISLTRSGSRLIFFDAYKVSTGSVITDDFHIYAPKGSSVYINNIQINPKTDTPEMQYNFSDTFIIPAIFSGQYELRLEHPACTMLTERIKIDNEEYSYYEVGSLLLNSSVKPDLAGKTEDIYRRIVASALGGNSFQSLNLTYTIDEWYREALMSSYDSMVRVLNRQDGYDGYESINITRVVDLSTQTELLSDGVYTCEMQIDYDYEYITQWGDEVSKHPGSERINIYFSYVFENGDWVLYWMEPGFMY